MVRSAIAGLGLISVLATVVFAGYLAVNSFGGNIMGGPASSTSSGGGAGSLTLRISGAPGTGFSGSYTTAAGSQNVEGTLGRSPTDYELSGAGVAGVNVVSANVQKRGANGGALKVEILKDGQVVQSQETNGASNTASVTYSS